ncbi:MAG: DivIVA domain-containing protein [Microbacteriaceae bacterium]
MAENEPFTSSFRGYEREEVDRSLERLQNELATLKQSNDGLLGRVEESRAELNVVQAKNRELSNRIKSVPEKANYTNLGSQFEEFLRVGEAKSDRLVSDARAEAELLRQTTQAKTSRLIREAEEYAQTLIAETHARVDEIRLKSETTAADTITQANVKLAEASEIISTARREAALKVADAERQIAEERSALKRHLELERAALQAISEQNARESNAADEEMRLREDQLERENLRHHREAVEAANRVIAEANDRASQVTMRASEVTAASESSLTQARVTANGIVADARSLAVSMINQARIRATDLTAKTRLHIDVLVDRMVARTERLREERELLDEFVTSVTDVRSAEMLVSHFEESLRSETIDSTDGSGR